MFVAIQEVQTGENVLLRRLSPTESIDPEFHAKKWADAMGVVIAECTGCIPTGCGDYYAETRDTKEATGVCWSNFDFFLSGEDDA